MERFFNRKFMEEIKISDEEMDNFMFQLSSDRPIYKNIYRKFITPCNDALSYLVKDNPDRWNSDNPEFVQLVHPVSSCDFGFKISDRKILEVRIPALNSLESVLENKNREYCFAVRTYFNDGQENHVMPLIIRRKSAYLLEVIREPEYCLIINYLADFLRTEYGISLTFIPQGLNISYNFDINGKKKSHGICVGVYLVFSYFINKKKYHWRNIFLFLKNKNKKELADIYKKIISFAFQYK